MPPSTVLRTRPSVAGQSPARRGTERSAAVVVATAFVVAGAWALSIHWMDGMDMGVATTLGSWGSFIGLWVVMMAAMMLPGALPALIRQPRPALFAAGYLAVWAVVGLVVYVAYAPHGSVAAGVVVLAAGGYELTGAKRFSRAACRSSRRSGIAYGGYCVGASSGWMAMLVVLGVMSGTWMLVIALIVTAQKALPLKHNADVALALAVVGLGVWILLAPSSVPGLLPAMTVHPSM